MKITLSWLKEHLNTTATIHAIAEKLTFIGLEVEEIIDKSAYFKHFVVAEIVATEKHPSADKLKVCLVNDNKAVKRIVCGASNAHAGIKVVLAPIGSRIPSNDLLIEQRTIRGIESNGMLCSAAELELSDEGGKIIELPTQRRVGEQFLYFDPIIDLNVTPNRGDCLSIRGIARELVGAGLGQLKNHVNKQISTAKHRPPHIKIALEDKRCSSFIGKMFIEVRNCTSPAYIQQRLRAVNIEPVSALVDISNYLMHEFGQPIHIYDADKLTEKLNIRAARDRERLLALNGIEYTLTEDMLVIADDHRVQAVAGIIGGEHSKCTVHTRNIFVEIACFNSKAIALTGQKLNCTTEARARFERGVDPTIGRGVMAMASQMITELCNGNACETVCVTENKPTDKHIITFNVQKVYELTACEISYTRIQEILEGLGFTISSIEGKIWTVDVPTWRFDIEDTADLVEEIIRIHGYEKIPALPFRNFNNSSANQPRYRDILMSRGLNEVITWSFMNSDNSLTENIPELFLLNPISKDLDVMRSSIIPNLLQVAQDNLTRNQCDIAIFEYGPVYQSTTQSTEIIAGIRVGNNAPRNIYNTQRNYDIFDTKADCLAILQAYGLHDCALTRNTPHYYHTKRSGCFNLDGKVLAYFGELHPLIKKNYKQLASSPVMLFEIFINSLPTKKHHKEYFIPSVYQTVWRDFAFVVDKEITADALITVVKNSSPEMITKVGIFDLYTGENIPVNKKSFAVCVALQAHDHSLSNREIQDISNNIIQAIKQEINGVLRLLY